MKRAFWILALGAVVSAIMAASIGRAESEPRTNVPQEAAR